MSTPIQNAPPLDFWIKLYRNFNAIGQALHQEIIRVQAIEAEKEAAEKSLALVQEAKANN